MAINKKIARQIAKQAALETYKALVNAPVKKVAGTQFRSAPSVKDIAKIAAAATYNTIVRLSTVMEEVPVDFFSIGTALQKTAPNFFRYITSSEYEKTQQVPTDVQGFVQYVSSGGKGEKWAQRNKWPQIVDAILTNVTADVRDGLKTYLLTLLPPAPPA